MQEPRAIHLWLFAVSFDSFDLRAAEAGMAAAGFEVGLARTDDGSTLQVRWQPDPALHPAPQTHAMVFEAGEPARAAFADISDLALQFRAHDPVPPIDAGLVHFATLEPARLPRDALAMRYALIVELAATAARPAGVLIHDPLGSRDILPAQAREALNQREFFDRLADLGTDPDPIEGGDTPWRVASSPRPERDRAIAAGVLAAAALLAALIGYLR